VITRHAIVVLTACIRGHQEKLIARAKRRVEPRLEPDSVEGEKKKRREPIRDDQAREIGAPPLDFPQGITDGFRLNN
jgi:hypothetical protein